MSLASENQALGHRCADPAGAEDDIFIALIADAAAVAGRRWSK